MGAPRCQCCGPDRTADKADESILAAYRIGSRDAYLGRLPLDVDGAESAALMDELGEHGPTTEANHAARSAMCEAYLDGWHDANSALQP